MGKVRPGNKLNSQLNGEWVTHARKGLKKVTSGLRRAQQKKLIRDSLEDDL